MFIKITDQNCQDVVMDLNYWSTIIRNDMNNPVLKGEVSTRDLARLKKRCIEFLGVPLIQALNECD